MGVCYSSRGKSQAAAILTDLAAKPQTARFVCAKIARHFINDDPPARAITRLEQAWLSSGGDLTQVAETLIDSPEAWEPDSGQVQDAIRVPGIQLPLPLALRGAGCAGELVRRRPMGRRLAG